MSLLCAISGEPAHVPVVSIKSGRVYEDRLIRKYLADHDDQDPIDGTRLDPARDLVAVASGASDPHGAAPPRSAHLTSVPALLTSLQSEYDSLLLEMASLRRQYDATRQELAAALYSNDAASRVIARIMRERDEARDALASVGSALPTASTSAAAAAPAASAPDAPDDADMPDAAVAAAAAAAASSLPADLVDTVNSLAGQLTSLRTGRSKRKAPTAYSGLTGYSAAKGAPLETRSSTPIAHPAQVAVAYPPFALVGAEPGAVDLVSVDGRAFGTLPLADAGVGALALALPAQPNLGKAAELPPFALAASADGSSVHVVALQDEIRVTATVSLASAGKDVSAFPAALAVHPSHAFFAVGLGETVAIYVPTGGDAVMRVDAAGELVTSVAFHPDGQLLVTGTASGKIIVRDIKTGEQMAVFEPTGVAEPQAGHAILTHGLAFSENGYTLASIAQGSLAAIVWDLRKLAPVAALTLAVQPTALAFDPNAQMLALAAPGELTLYATKGFKPLLTSPLDPESTPTAIGWDQATAELAVVLSSGHDAAISVLFPTPA